MKSGWEHFEHQSDIGVRGYGATKSEAFAHVAKALMAVMVESPATLQKSTRYHVHCEAPSDDLLLIDWLNEIIYRVATEKCAFVEFQVRMEDHCLEAEISGEPLDPVGHPLVVEVKGATYSQLRVAQDGEGTWVAQCIVDV